MAKTTTVLVAIFFLACLLFQTGCSGGKEPGIDAKTDMSIIKSALKKAQKAPTTQDKIYFLRRAYDCGGELQTRWPDSERIPEFLEKYGTELKRIPRQVYTLSMKTRDMDSFRWAIACSNKNDLLQYSELLKIWKMGKQWRDYYISEYPKETLSIFMSEAVNNGNSIRFFNQYIGDFKASAYRLEFPLEKTEFNVRFCRFFADMINTAMKKEDVARIGFLIDHMPSNGSVTPQIDLKTKDTMRALGDYVCHELKDEVLACKLVNLGYDMNRVDIDVTGFGNDFAKALIANPEHAITHVLKLNEWQGALTRKETNFLLTLPDPALRLVHQLHLNEATETAIKGKDAKKAMRLIKLQEDIRPITVYDYGRFLDWAIEYQNRTIYDYVRLKCTQVDVYRLDLSELAKSQYLFRMHAPKILKKIYRTMNTLPKSDGTTLGRIDDLLTSHRPEAVLYVVKKYDLNNAWTKVPTDGRTLLMAVCEGGNLEAAKYLIENKGADVHAHTDYTEATTTVFGRARPREGKLSPIFFAAKSGNSELIKYLCSKGEQVNARTAFGATPLMYAVDNNHLEAVKTFISLRANVNTAMYSSLSPSDLASVGIYPEISTAYRRAKKIGNKEILDVLKKAGAPP